MEVLNIMEITTGFTATPNYILLDNRISGGAKLTWQIFAMRENFKNWTHHLKAVAKMLNKHVDTIRGYVRELINFNYLIRTPKNNGEFGYIYSIPENHIPVKKKSTEKITVEKSSAVKISANNNKDLTNKNLNKRERNNTPTPNCDLKRQKQYSSQLTKSIDPIIQDKKSTGVLSLSALVPQGEWKDPETKWFRQGFVEWKAKWAMRQFKDLATLDDAIIWAEANLSNHPENLPRNWMQYQRDFALKADNAVLRLKNDIALKPEEQNSLARSYIELNQTPVNQRAKFNLTLMTTYQKMGGKNRLGNFVDWTKSEQVNQLYQEWLKNN